MLTQFLHNYREAKLLKKARKVRVGHVVVLERKKRFKAHEVIGKSDNDDGTVIFVLRPVQKSVKFNTVATHRELVW